jgi:hypothetical protein
LAGLLGLHQADARHLIYPTSRTLALCSTPPTCLDRSDALLSRASAVRICARIWRLRSSISLCLHHL